MLRSDLLRRLVADNPDLGVDSIEALVNGFFARVTRQLAQGGRVELDGLGTFTTRARASRIGHLPQNGGPIPVTARRVPFFKPAKDMRVRLMASTAAASAPGYGRTPHFGTVEMAAIASRGIEGAPDQTGRPA